MLQNMKEYALERPTTTRNAYKEAVVTYTSQGYTLMFIAFSAIKQAEQNNVAIDKYTHLGLTRDSHIQKGDRIDGKYTVQYVLPSKPFNRVFLLEVI